MLKEKIISKKRPRKETRKRDLEKRPRKETQKRDVHFKMRIRTSKHQNLQIWRFWLCDTRNLQKPKSKETDKYAKRHPQKRRWRNILQKNVPPNTRHPIGGCDNQSLQRRGRVTHICKVVAVEGDYCAARGWRERRRYGCYWWALVLEWNVLCVCLCVCVCDFRDIHMWWYGCYWWALVLEWNVLCVCLCVCVCVWF